MAYFLLSREFPITNGVLLDGTDSVGGWDGTFEDVESSSRHSLMSRCAVFFSCVIADVIDTEWGHKTFISQQIIQEKSKKDHKQSSVAEWN